MIGWSCFLSEGRPLDSPNTLIVLIKETHFLWNTYLAVLINAKGKNPMNLLAFFLSTFKNLLLFIIFSLDALVIPLKIMVFPSLVKVELNYLKVDIFLSHSTPKTAIHPMIELILPRRIYVFA